MLESNVNSEISSAADKKAAGFEKILLRKKNTQTVTAAALCYYLSFALSGGQAFLHKAYHLATTALESDRSGAKHYFTVVFLCRERGFYERAYDMLSNIKQYKNYFKNNEPDNFALYTYFDAMAALDSGKRRSAEKLYDVIEDYADDKNSGLIYILLASLKMNFGRYSEAYGFLELAYNAGSRSPFLYIALYDCFEKADPASFMHNDLILPFTSWGIAHGLDLNVILNKWQDAFTKQLDKNPAYGEKIYKTYPIDWILNRICRHLMAKNDISEAAFYYYKEAETKQLNIGGLSEALVRSAFNNGIEEISRYMLSQYLKFYEVSLDIKPFVYHLLLTDAKYSDLAIKRQNDIIQFGFYCLENKLRGYVYNSVYKFLLDMEDDGHIKDPKLLAPAEEQVRESAFIYQIDIANPKVKRIWIFEKEKKEAAAYEVKNGTVKITACTSDFTYSCFSDNMRHIIPEKPRITKLVKNADYRLYQRLFNKKVFRTELVVALSKYYMSPEEFNSDVIPRGGELVLEMAIRDPSVSNSFKNQASAALANFFAMQNQYKNAVRFYKNVDENYLSDKEIERMLSLFITASELDKAAELIAKKAECISDGQLFSTVKKLIAADSIYGKTLADAAYKLIIRGWYDKSLTELVFSSFTGSQQQWQELSRSLTAMGVRDSRLDEIILDNAIRIHRIDKDTQKIFVKMLNQKMDSQFTLVKDFSHYLVYEIIMNGFKPEYETIALLEGLLLSGRAYDGHFLAYALCHVYIANGFVTFHSDEILRMGLRYCEEDGFILPIFRQIKDKTLLTTYIEKNQPFIYKGSRGKKVSLFYKANNEEHFSEKPMKYIGFGLYAAFTAHFYGEKLEYYFVEQMSSGSIVTKQNEIENNNVHLLDSETDFYYLINNALLYEHLFKYDKVEEIITDMLEEIPRVRSWIM